MKKDAYYFSHDANAQEDPKCILLIEQLGMEGYGIYWGLVERLRQEKEYKLPLIIIPAFSRKWNTSKEKVDTVIRNFGLFEIDGEMFFSIRLTRSMEEYNSLRNKYIEYGRKGGLTSAKARLYIGSSNPQALKESKIKKKKGKENKENESKVFIPPSVSDVVNFFEENGYSKQVAEKAHLFYSNNNWKDSNDKPVRNWKSKMISVWFKDENKKINSNKNNLSVFEQGMVR